MVAVPVLLVNVTLLAPSVPPVGISEKSTMYRYSSAT